MEAEFNSEKKKNRPCIACLSEDVYSANVEKKHCMPGTRYTSTDDVNLNHRATGVYYR